MPSPASPHLLWIARFDYGGGVRVFPHAHAFHQALFIVRGTAAARINGEAVRFALGDFVWLPPDTVHEWSIPSGRFLETLDMKFVGMGGAGLDQWTVTARPELKILFTCLLEVALGGKGDRTRCCDLLLEALLLRAAQATAPADSPEAAPIEGGDHPVLGRMLRLFEESPGKPWTSGEIARQLHLSYRRLSQLSQEHCGQSPLQVLRQIRLRQASEQLLYSEWTIKEISEICGFGGVHQFTRAFRKHVGKPPALWREEARQRRLRSIEVDPRFKNTLRLSRGKP
ncbi:MAG: helix-turn-helix domain-containing protein [Opitutales bacterium]|nr:helix-turn-helix domain-containing protein [Opitutales bacterium]